MKRILNYIILVVLIGLTLWLVIGNNDFSNLPELISNTNKGFLSLAFLCMVIFWFCEAYILYCMKKTLHIYDSYKSSFKLCMIGQYYSAITPFSSGGQPAQIYSLVNEGVSVGVATSIFINKFLIYQVVITSYSVFMLILRFNFLYDKLQLALPFVIVGFILNVIVLITIFGFFLNEKLIKSFLARMLKIGHRIKLIKDLEKSEQKLNKSLSDYKTSIEKMKSNKTTTIKLVLVSIIQLTFNLGITYFVYLAVGLRNINFLDVLALQSLHYMAVCFMPTPGTAGAAEGGFYMLFGSIFPKNILSYALLLWRFIDYYLRLMITGLVTLVDFINQKRKLKITIKEI